MRPSGWTLPADPESRRSERTTTERDFFKPAETMEYERRRASREGPFNVLRDSGLDEGELTTSDFEDAAGIAEEASMNKALDAVEKSAHCAANCASNLPNFRKFVKFFREFPRKFREFSGISPDFSGFSVLNWPIGGADRRWPMENTDAPGLASHRGSLDGRSRTEPARQAFCAGRSDEGSLRRERRPTDKRRR